MVYKGHRYKQVLVPIPRGKSISDYLLIHAFILYLHADFLYELVMVFALVGARGRTQGLGKFSTIELDLQHFRLYCLWRTFTYVGIWIVDIFHTRKTTSKRPPQVGKA